MADLKLRTTRDLAAQLTNTEWLASFPGTDEQKASTRGCEHRHALERMTRPRHDADTRAAAGAHRMAGALSRHRRSEGVDPRLRALPFAGAHDAVASRRRRIRRGRRADVRLPAAGVSVDAAAHAVAPHRRRTGVHRASAGGMAASGRVPEHSQPERRTRVAVYVQDAAPSERRCDARDLHRIRSAEAHADRKTADEGT